MNHNRKTWVQTAAIVLLILGVAAGIATFLLMPERAASERGSEDSSTIGIFVIVLGTLVALNGMRISREKRNDRDEGDRK